MTWDSQFLIHGGTADSKQTGFYSWFCHLLADLGWFCALLSSSV